MIRNLTPHPVVILRDHAEGSVTGVTGTGPKAKEGRFAIVAEFLPSGLIARAKQDDETVGEVEIDGYEVPLIETKYGSLSDLPDPEDGVYNVVSVVTAQTAKVYGRTTGDLLITSDPVRDGAGRIIGARKFARV